MPLPAVVISYNLWQRRFGGDPNAIGRKIPVEGTVSTILGVMPPGFSIFGKRDADIWFPERLTHPSPGQPYMTKWLRVIGRLKPGTTLEQANTELDLIGRRVAEQFPLGNEGMTFRAKTLRESYSEGSERTLMTLMAAVGFVLLIACANVAGLTMVQATTRSREVAIRSAIGASRARMARQFLSESVLLALTGGALGVLLAFLGGRVLTARFSGMLDSQAFDPDYRVLGFTLAVALVTGLLFGLAPAIQGTRSDLREALNEGGRGGGTGAGRQRMRNAFVVTQVALAVVLLVGAGLMINSIVRLERINPGFDASNLITFQVQLPRDAYTKTSTSGQDFLDYSPAIPALFDDVLARLKSLPGVESSGGATWLPLNNFWMESRNIMIAGRPQAAQKGRPMFALYNTITPGFFRTMRTPVLRGRDIAEKDDAASPWVALINKTMAEQYWAGADPIGDMITAIHMMYPEKPREVIGIVADVRHISLGMKPVPAIYIPHEQQPAAFSANRQRSRLHMTYALRTRSRPEDLVPSIRAAVAQAGPAQPIYDVKTMEQFLDEGTSGQRFLLTLLGIFGAIALSLSAVGIYGVMAYSVAQRTQEIGIRIAMGAPPRAVLAMVLRRGVALTAVGLLIGIGGAYGLTRFIGSWLFGITPTDPATFAAACAALASVALFACLVPALRATRVDPVAALRSE
jgi:predicted permease